MKSQGCRFEADGAQRAASKSDFTWEGARGSFDNDRADHR
jgi:hypothetical protein